MSASEIFDLIRPAITIASAVASTCVLASARKRFPFYQAFLWAGATFFLPLVIVPLYLAFLVLFRRPRVKTIRYRFIIPPFYLLVILAIFGSYTYMDSRTVDAHLSRAAFANVLNDNDRRIREYREALELEDNPHNHKLLAAALDDAHVFQEAIREYQIAESGGEPDDTIHYKLAALFERVGRKDEAIAELRKFVLSETCKQIDNRCESAREEIKQK